MKKHISIPNKRDYLVKENCLVEARKLVTSGKIDMEIKECAKEIFAHAVVLHAATMITPIAEKCKYLIEHADPIDLEDGGDTPERQRLYRIIWDAVPSGHGDKKK